MQVYRPLCREHFEVQVRGQLFWVLWSSRQGAVQSHLVSFTLSFLHLYRQQKPYLVQHSSRLANRLGCLSCPIPMFKSKLVDDTFPRSTHRVPVCLGFNILAECYSP